MHKIVLISCGKSKRRYRSKAFQLYTGLLFQKSLAYARHIKADEIFILSAMYGLLELEQEVEPYEKTLRNMPVDEVRRWGNAIIEELRARTDLVNDHFVILAGHVYRSQLLTQISRVDLPLEHLRLGEQLRFLTEAIS